MFDASEEPIAAPLSGSGLGHVVAVLNSAAEALGALAAGELADGSLSALLRDLDPVFNRLDAARASLVGAWDYASPATAASPGS